MNSMVTGHVATKVSPRATLLVRTSEELGAIRDEHVDTCVWRRALDAAAERDLAAFTASRDPFESQLLVPSSDDIATRLGPMFSAFAPPELRWALAKDVVSLVQLYREIVRPDAIRVALSLLADDACRRFHSDELGVRLVCTYAGPGTECAPDGAVDRRALGREYPSTELANLAIVQHTRAIRCAAVGDVVLLKGDAWPGNAGRGAIHRSPPIEALGIRRLVLVVNAPPARES